MLKVLIVGCGNISGRFDFGRSLKEARYSHAGVYEQDGRFEIVACVDPCEQRRAEFMTSYNCQLGFESIQDAVKHQMVSVGIDVVNICSPTKFHDQDLLRSIEIAPRLIFCEKPIAKTYALAKTAVDLCRKNDISLVVNYSRRFDPFISSLAQDIKDGKWGELLSVICIYGKGLLNNGSHFIDLLHLLIGPLRFIDSDNPSYDYFDDDPTITARFQGQNNVSVHLIGLVGASYTQFEMQLFFSAGVLSMEAGGFRWRERCSQKSETFPGYMDLSEGLFYDGDYSSSMKYAIKNIYEVINSGAEILCSGDDALRAQKICDEVLLSSK